MEKRNVSAQEIKKEVKDLKDGKIDGSANGLDSYRTDENGLETMENENCTGGFDDGTKPCK